MSDLDLNALDTILKSMGSAGFDDPGGEEDWIAALAAWTIDEHEQLNRDDPVRLAQRLATIWEIGNLVEKELSGRFRIRATRSVQFPYVAEDGELMGGVVDTHTLKILSEDPREIACAIVAEVLAAAKPEHNVVMFRRLVTKLTLRKLTLRYETSFGLARVE